MTKFQNLTIVTIFWIIVLNIFGLIFSLWLAGSLVASAIKRIDHACGQEYKIERFVQGDWFCPR